MWWPSEARRELGVGLSDFLLNLGWLYNRLVMTYSVPPETFAHQAAINHPGITLPILGSTAALVDGYTGGPDERTGLLGAALTSGLNSNIREFMSMCVKFSLICYSQLTMIGNCIFKSSSYLCRNYCPRYLLTV